MPRRKPIEAEVREYLSARIKIGQAAAEAKAAAEGRRLRRRGISARRTRLRNKVLRLRAAGMSLRDIARATGLGKDTVWLICREDLT